MGIWTSRLIHGGSLCPLESTIDLVVDRVERNDRLGCFVDRLDRLHRLVDDFTTQLDLADFRST